MEAERAFQAMESEIGRWLSSLEMPQYVSAFEENDITLLDLPDLTDADLKDLGVASMGHRKAILRASSSATNPQDGFAEHAVELKATATASKLAVSSVADNPIHRPGSAERRQLTVMFADLVGSTELAGVLDPEDMREAITLYQECVTKHVNAIEGNVAKYMGDGVLCYFGWPQAHEDDPERAARAALNIISDLESAFASNGDRMEARIGIATGLVVVGDLIGEGASQEEAVIGETPNLAARLQGVAEPGQVVVSDTTRHLLSHSIEVKHLGQRDLKGISRPVDVYVVQGEHDASTIAGANLSTSSAPLVGRETELSLLMDRWSNAVEGEGQVFVLSGEAGIGKSQISAAFVNNLEGQPHRILQFQCSPYYANTTFYPVIGYIERSAGFSRHDANVTKLDKLETLLQTVFDDTASVVALFAAMLSLPLDRYPAIGLEPLKQREKTIDAFVDFLAGQSKQSPLLFLFEDLHWCDASTLDMLEAAVQRVENLPVFLLITHRPEFESPWQSFGHVTQYNLNRLPKRHSLSIVDGVTKGKKLPRQIVDQILEKTDGIPLFVEELTRTVLDAGFLVENDGAYILEGPLPPFAVPSSLQDSLMAKLDRLSPLKDVAQTGASIGREFSFELLAFVSPQTNQDLQNSLQELVQNELISVRGTPPDSIYTFKHALVQDAAYSSLLKSRRQQLHAKIANALTEQFATQVELQPELAAQHFSAAGLVGDAVPLWLSAGLIAISKSANEEAIHHLTNGLNCLAATVECH
ncbi:adenylate/guanylate cyclase domain-containing protein [Shimia sp.]|uniref:adenylate/guanylate cyclase domain-containing protein n=1 Tax=Shimia sp. TaxID=1954381 RepID=UPI00329A2EA7